MDASLTARHVDFDPWEHYQRLTFGSFFYPIDPVSRVVIRYCYPSEALPDCFSHNLIGSHLLVEKALRGRRVHLQVEFSEA